MFAFGLVETARLMRQFSQPVVNAVETACDVVLKWEVQRAGAGTLRGKTERTIPAAVTKGDELGHHAVVTPTDLATQELILHDLLERHPDAWFITEEKVDQAGGFSVLTDDSLDRLRRGVGYGVDPLDGTSQFARDLYEYSVSIGVMIDGQHIGGAIAAPAVRGGLMLVGESGAGVFLNEVMGDSLTLKPVDCLKKVGRMEDSMMCVGPDVFLSLDRYGMFLQTVSRLCRTVNCIGSCALGLALVALGRIDALIQPAHYPWDWFAGLPLVREVGGVVRFYHYRRGGIEFLDEPDRESYSSVKRNTAFIAGAPWLVEKLAVMLVARWRKRSKV